MNLNFQTNLAQATNRRVIFKLSLLFLLLVCFYTGLTLYQIINGVEIAQRFLTNCGVGLTAGLSAFWFAKKGRSTLAACILMGTVLLLVIYTTIFLGLGIKAPLVMNLSVITLIASFSLGKRWSRLLTLMNCALLVGLFTLELFNGLPALQNKPFSPATNTMAQLVALYMISYFIGSALQTRNEMALASVQANNEALEKALGDKDRANRAKDGFLNMMSHEIRTPMAGIRTAIELLKDPRISAEKRERYLRAIDTSTASLLNLLNDMLNTTQMESVEICVVENPFWVGELVHDTANLFELAAQQKHLALIVEHSEALNTLALGDSARLRQMLSNLLGNAVKYTSTGHIRLATIKQEIDKDSDLWTFTVSDTGPGLSVADQQRLFKAHTRLQNATESNEEGSGLGLSIVKRLAKAMNGEVGVSSQLGVGSRFWFQIPLKRNV
ncbi:MAG: ATP-binding protein [Burkholderiales bacterium]|nr:ATP-binding protein [Burkholderiales bacterium]